MLRVPQLADPGVLRVVGDQPLPLRARAGHHVEVVHVVARRRHRRTMRAMRDQDQVAAAYLREHVDRPIIGSVHPLVSDRIVALDTFRYVVGQLQLEVVDLLELALLPRPVLVMLVRRVRRPVPRRRDHFTGDDRVGVEDTRDTEVPDLTGSDARAAQFGLDLIDRDPPERVIRGCLRMWEGDPGATGAHDGEGGITWDVRQVRRTRENIISTPEGNLLPFDDHLGRSAQREHDVLTVAGVDLDRLSGNERADRQPGVMPVRFARAHHQVEAVSRRRPSGPEPFSHRSPRFDPRSSGSWWLPSCDCSMDEGGGLVNGGGYVAVGWEQQSPADDETPDRGQTERLAPRGVRRLRRDCRVATEQ